MEPVPHDAYYAALGETDRLTRTAAGRLEFDRTRELIGRHLPPGAALEILDVGGATGAHAAWLAALGHRVEVVDPVAAQVEVAARLPGVSARVGDARDLHRDDASCDVVLLLGPLYHLADAGDRARALAEARRVTRPGGVVAAATIARHASLLDLAVTGRLDAAAQARVARTLADGRHDPALGFTDAWFARAEQVVVEFAAAGLPGARTFGIEGPGFLGLRAWEAAGGEVPERVYAGVLAAARAVESEPTAVGAGSHLLTVATVGR